MATDKSEPRVGLIVKIGVLSIATLVAVHAGLVAYYDDIAHAEEHRKIGEIKPEALINLHEDEARRLTSGPLPIDKAMQQLAARGRMASPDIAPSASKDVAPLQGWSKMPGEVPPAMTAEPAPGPADAKLDGGAGAALVDGAVPKAAPERRPDGGPGAKPPPRKP